MICWVGNEGVDCFHSRKLQETVLSTSPHFRDIFAAAASNPMIGKKQQRQHEESGMQSGRKNIQSRLN